MTVHTDAAPSTDIVRAVRLSVLGLAGLVVLKFVALLAEYDWNPAKAPWLLLVVVAIPTVLVVRLSRSRPRGAAGLALPLLALWLVAVALAVAKDGLTRQSWADYPSAYVGALLALWGIWAAVQVLRRR